jgi:hypothetical protein
MNTEFGPQYEMNVDFCPVLDEHNIFSVSDERRGEFVVVFVEQHRENICSTRTTQRFYPIWDEHIKNICSTRIAQRCYPIPDHPKISLWYSMRIG